jgi:glutaredoxin/glutathione-dependent peroxiredoxin
MSFVASVSRSLSKQQQRYSATAVVRSFSSTMTTMSKLGVGTDMKQSDVILQRARPWHMSDAEGSNKAVDNAVSMTDLFKGKRVAFFGVPAPFTGTCSHEHYPPYKALAADFKKEPANVDKIVCYSVADPYAHYGWSVALKNDDNDIEFLADVDGDFAKEFGVDAVYEPVSLGERSIRFSMLVDDGIVKAYNIVEDATKDAENVLQAAKDIPK